MYLWENRGIQEAQRCLFRTHLIVATLGVKKYSVVWYNGVCMLLTILYSKVVTIGLIMG